VLRVPSRLAIRVDSSGAYASKVAGLDLVNINGDVTAVDIDGPVTGQTRGGGDVRVTGATTVKLLLTRSSATFEHIQKGLTLDIRQGECRVAASSGPVQVDEASADVTISNHDGPIRVAGSNGRIVLEDPRDESRVDVTRAEVEVRVTKAVPLTLLTTDDTLRLLLDPATRATIDAFAEIGQIQAQDFSWQPEAIEKNARLSQSIGGGGPRISMRNLRGEIVIRKSK